MTVFFGKYKGTPVELLLLNAPDYVKWLQRKQEATNPLLWLKKEVRFTTIERLRAQGSQDLPSCRTIGRSKRYDEQVVEQWIRDAGSAKPAKASQANTTGTLSNTITLTALKGAPNGNA